MTEMKFRSFTCAVCGVTFERRAVTSRYCPGCLGNPEVREAIQKQHKAEARERAKARVDRLEDRLRKRGTHV